MSELITDRKEVFRIIGNEGDDAVQCRNTPKVAWRPIYYGWLEPDIFPRIEWRRTPKPVPPGDLTYEQVVECIKRHEPVQFWDEPRERWTDSGANLGWKEWFLDAEFAYRRKPALKRVPLGPEDVPPGSVFKWDCWDDQLDMQHSWAWVTYVGSYGLTVIIALNSSASSISWDAAMNGGQIKRPGEDWQPCYKEI